MLVVHVFHGATKKDQSPNEGMLGALHASPTISISETCVRVPLTKVPVSFDHRNLAR
jgi:hypothetical protein